MKTLARTTCRRGPAAFALITTLIIVSVLAVVAVGFLSSMIGERQTADAYTSRSRAEQAAQAGVEGAIAILEQSLRDYPDSATAWDVHQGGNSGGSADNEGTTLYLRAVPTQTSGGTTVPNPNPHPASATAADDALGNGPDNLARSCFALPLVSGVPSGNPRLVSEKSAILPTVNFELDPATQTSATASYGTDLNVRRYAGDTQGVIGSPPNAAASPTPKPAGALWVNLKGSDGRVTGRYAFWTEDESFRANNSFFGDGQTPPTPPDNTARPKDSVTGKPRTLLPGDLSLLGPLTASADPNAAADATSIVQTRGDYAGGFFPDPLAFVHADGSASGAPAISPVWQDTLRYLLTNQSGALNLTRHGTQRLNLNTAVTSVDLTHDLAPYSTSTKAIQLQIDHLVQTLKFHLPYFGERFYRTAIGTSSSQLNDATQVPGSPVSYAVGSDHSTIYYYKVAADIRDAMDADSQPTAIAPGGQLYPIALPVGTLDDDQAAGHDNTFWAMGQESVPHIQEVSVRYRPIVATDSGITGYPKGHFSLVTDYYIEFWNMTDRDIYACKQPAPYDTLPTLNNATIYVRGQQMWAAYNTGNLLVADNTSTTNIGPGHDLLTNNGALADWQIDLSNNVQGFDSNRNPVAADGTGGKPLGVVFRAGTVTVITTDPQVSTWKGGEPGGNFYQPIASLTNVFLCPLISGQRQYLGKVIQSNGMTSQDGGLMMSKYDFTGSVYSGTEVSLVNPYGYLDIVRGTVTKTGGNGNAIYTNTDRYISQPAYYNDFSYGGGLMGNVFDSSGSGSIRTANVAVTPSQLGDPRTNNEQLSIAVNANSSDGSHFVPGTRSVGAPYAGTTQQGTGIGGTLQPDTFTVAGQAWPDYYAMPPQTVRFTPYPSPTAATAPMVIADDVLSSVGQLGDVFDPARVAGTAGLGVTYSRGGGRTFKIGQHDDRYSTDPGGNAAKYNLSAQAVDNIPASNAWAAWRLADVFDVSDPIELPARINVNGVLRDQGAALLSMLQGLQFQPATVTLSPPVTAPSLDPVLHGDGHVDKNSSPLAAQPLDTSSGGSHGFAPLVTQIAARLRNATPANGPSGPFFERGEFGELGDNSTQPIFGVNPTSATATANTLLVTGVDMNKTFDHGREELFRRIAQLLCTRGDTFTVYAVGQSISQRNVNGPMKVTGTQRMRVTFRLVPKQSGGQDFHPAYDVVGNAVAPKTYTDYTDASASGRFARVDHYDAQILQTSVY